MTPRTYTSPEAFKQALEQRLRTSVKSGAEFARKRQLLVATVQPLEAKRLRAALEQTFTFRKTHALPPAVPTPLEAWGTPYAMMAREDQLHWPTLADVTRAAQGFLDPVLAGLTEPSEGRNPWHPVNEWQVRCNLCDSARTVNSDGRAEMGSEGLVALSARRAPRQ